ncbi:MAG: hypothetical protein R6W97_11275 [Thiobacillus sp.]
MLVGLRNRVGFQNAAVSLTAADISYSAQLSPNNAYQTSAAGANPATSRFAMCSVERTDIGMWFMGVRGFGDQAVRAYAVATLAPAQTSCTLPIGFCRNEGAPLSGCEDPDEYGLCVGDWRDGRFEAGGSVFGAFNWIDFTGKGGGAAELKDLLITGMCDIQDDSTVEKREDAKPGLVEAASIAWNTRFGLYKNGQGHPTPTSAPPALPDFTGFGYTPATWPGPRNAFADFLARRVANDPYQDKIPGFITSGKPQHIGGADRRIVPVPMVKCSDWVAKKTIKIDAWACVLMLHPIDKPTDPIYMEYLGLASEPGTPCSSYGLGGGTIGPLVPVLVQ